MNDSLMSNDRMRMQERAAFLRRQIDEISAQLRGWGIPPDERLMMNAERKVMRRELEEIEAAIAKTTGAA